MAASEAARDAVDWDGAALRKGCTDFFAAGRFFFLASRLRMRDCSSLSSRTKNPFACRHRLWYCAYTREV